MSPLIDCIEKKKTRNNPIWIMRQAGRYLPEFREIRKNNPDFIKLCLSPKLSSEITLQPLKRFNLDAAIIFSDILMIPLGVKQDVKFKKNFGPQLGDINFETIKNISEEEFSNILSPVYDAINITSQNDILKNKDLFGFVGAPWTILVYMLNKKSPKKKLDNNFFNNKELIYSLIKIITKFTKLHLKNQIDSGATIVQIFDSWAGILQEKDYPNYIYEPTKELVKYVKTLNVPVICFPRGIKNYREYCNVIKPDVISIDYEVNPKEIASTIDIPIQGGLDPKILLTDTDIIKRESKKYLDIFRDHPYIFNLGHGILPETNPEYVDYLVKYVKNY
tara:strand:- start:2337 stop:3338 length:1002 start_codon:yes stop_codon:yes gene_type:complete